MKNPITQEETDRIDNLCKQYNIKNYTINDDGVIDVNGDVNLYLGQLETLQLTFNVVSGNFYCTENELTSLIGCPKEVSGDFRCGYNKMPRMMRGNIILVVNFTCIRIVHLHIVKGKVFWRAYSQNGQ